MFKLVFLVAIVFSFFVSPVLAAKVTKDEYFKLHCDRGTLEIGENHEFRCINIEKKFLFKSGVCQSGFTLAYQKSANNKNRWVCQKQELYHCPTGYERAIDADSDKKNNCKKPIDIKSYSRPELK